MKTVIEYLSWKNIMSILLKINTYRKYENSQGFKLKKIQYLTTSRSINDRFLMELVSLKSGVLVKDMFTIHFPLIYSGL